MNRVRWGLIGTGDIVRKRVAPALIDSPDCDIVAVSRGRPELAAAFASDVGARRWYPQWEQLVADADVQCVYIATPVSLHAAQAIAAAEAGKHVLCEKPMAMTAGECDRMIAACRAHGVRLGVAYYRHFYPVLARCKEILASGEIGSPVFAQMHAFEPFAPSPEHPRAWVLDPAMAGGGPMMDFGCHRLEVLIHLFGPVHRATGVLANVVFPRAVEDTAAVLLQFDAGPCGAVVVTHAAHDRLDTLQVFGTKGSMQIDELNAGSLRIHAGDRSRVESHPPAANIHRPLIDDFVAALRTNREPAVTGEVGRAVAAIEDQIYAVAPSIR